MINQIQIKPIPLCSRCIAYEINSWVFENAAKLGEETTQKVREELKAIKLQEGECLVCKNGLISVDSAQNIIKIFEKNKVDEKTKKEFIRLFSFFETQ